MNQLFLPLKQVKTLFVLRSIFITYLLGTSHLLLIAQEEVNKATLNLLSSPVLGGSRIIEFKPSTIILKVKMNNAKQYLEQEIPASAIKDILKRYDWSSGRGVLKGLLIGAGIGAVIGSGLYFVGPATAIVASSISGAAVGLGVGGKKKKRFRINGVLEEYQKHQAEMQELLTNK